MILTYFPQVNGSAHQSGRSIFIRTNVVFRIYHPKLNGNMLNVYCKYRFGIVKVRQHGSLSAVCCGGEIGGGCEIDTF